MASLREESRRKRLRWARAGGFTLTEGVHSEGSAIPWHTHDTPTICCVLEGGFIETSRGASLTCTPATTKFMPAGERHSDRFNLGPARGLLIEVNPQRRDSLESFGRILDEPRAFHGGPVWTVVIRLLSELQLMDNVSPLAIEGLLLELLAAASRIEERAVRGPTPRWLRLAEEMIEAQLASPPDLAAIAAAVEVHPVTLARSFRRTHGCTIGEYIRRRRIDRAIEQLKESPSPLAEIALRNGFADQSHFCNLFRRYTGVTPSQFRRAVRRS
jgi:AraC family transcriptional regulator